MRLVRILAVVVLLLLAVLAMAGALYEPNTAIPPGFAGKHVTVLGAPIRVLQRGSGRDVLLIHGSPGSLEDWAEVVSSLGDSVRSTAFDRPGHGYSADTHAYSPESNADAALALMDALGLDRVVVVGHSFGGATALAMAARAPSKVSAYVILDSATYEPIRKRDGVLRILTTPVVGQGAAVLIGSLLAPAKIRKGILEQFDGRAPPPNFIEVRTTIWSSPKVTHATAVETVDAAENLRALSPRYPGIRKPVYILAEADQPARRAAAERLHADIPGSSLELLAGTGHYVQFERTAEVVTAIRRAVEETTR